VLAPQAALRQALESIRVEVRECKFARTEQRMCGACCGQF
jgi:hypothetical protein